MPQFFFYCGVLEYATHKKKNEYIPRPFDVMDKFKTLYAFTCILIFIKHF